MKISVSIFQKDVILIERMPTQQETKDARFCLHIHTTRWLKLIAILANRIHIFQTVITNSSVALIRERPPLVDEVSANFCG
jgi:uncharacterized protein YmfQ (DUF2313 family)